ncbi:MAG TPA: hypothetical protein VHC70_15830, partial [Phycisphaerales bacterium]|nr:hypothetical protein [Phycisphaerales bacterium]
FLSVEGVAARRVARISGSMGAGKTALGDGLFEHAEPFPSVVVNQNPPAPFAVLPGGDIVAGGIDFATADGGDRSVLARFNGGTWSHFTPDLLAADLYGPPYPPLGVVKSLVTLPSGDLLVGGLFFLDGDPFFHFLVRWDGTQWTDMGIISGAVEKMIVKPNGHVIIAGDFTAANGVPGADYICEWDGTSTFGDGTPEYTPLGQGADGPVNAIALLANGDLIAAGDFQNVGNTSPGDLQVNRIARWDGTSWSRLGSGLSNSAYALAVMPGGDVVVGGGFTASATISGETATPAMNRIGRWNGSAWSPLGTATVNGVGGAGLITNINIPTGSVYSLAVTSAGVLLVGGDFVTTDFDTAAPVSNGRPSAYLARWADCVGACCQSDGSCTVGAGSPSAVCAAGTLVPGGACSPNACPQPGGVCCRGATCNATVTQANCLGDGPAGASYVSASSVCNAGGSTATPCCYADYDKSGTIAVSDIFAFLNSWFAGSPFALVGGDGASGTLAVSHIFDFLNAWFAGGC